MVTGQGTPSAQIIKFEENSFNSGWFYFNQHDERVNIPSLPAQIPAEQGSACILHELSPVEDKNTALCFYSQHQNIIVRLNGEKIYEFDTKARFRPLISYRPIYNFVSLPAIQQDSILSIETIAAVPSSAGLFEKMLLGDGAHIIFTITLDHIDNFLLGFLFILASVFLFGTNHLFSKANKNDSTLVTLSALTLFIGLWQLDDSTLLLFLTGNLPFLWCMKYLTQLFLPVLTFLFVNSIIVEKNQKFMNFLFWLIITVVSSQYLLQIFGIKALTNTIFLSHVLYLITCIYTVKALSKEEWLKSGWLKNLFLASMFFSIAIFAFTALSLFANKFFGTLMSFGLALTFISMILLAYQKKIALFEALSKADTYKNLAFVDIATGVNNKTAWYTLVENFDSSRPQGEYCLIIFDMNNLKKLNDTYGHLTGDKVIKAFCDCLVKTVDGKGDIYRIGGDEFICLCYNMYRESVMTMLHNFETAVKNQQETEHAFTAAYGFEFFTPHSPADFEKALTQADENMYAKKLEMKASQN